MSRRTKAQMEAERAAIARAAALCAVRLTADVEPDVPPPSINERGNRLTVGWIAYGHGDYPRAVPGCSSSVHHGAGRTDRTSSQNAIALHSTKSRALRAARRMVEIRMGGILAKLDADIIAAEKEEDGK